MPLHDHFTYLYLYLPISTYIYLVVQDTTDLRVLSRAYMEMLRDLSPPLNASSRWSSTRERIRDDSRFKVTKVSGGGDVCLQQMMLYTLI